MKRKNVKKTSFVFTLFLAAFLFFTGTNTYAATVGDQLTAPEVGWTRFDDTNTLIKYEGKWQRQDDRRHSGGSMVYTDTVGAKIKFKYYGTKLRVIDSFASNRSTDIVISIDGVEETFSQYASSDTHQTLCYEKTNLPLGYHEVIITNGTKRMDFDAIDIDVDGTLVDIDTPIPEEPETPTTPEQPFGNRAILVVTLTTGLEKEYDLSMEEVNDFIEWYEVKQAGSGRASYAIDKHDNNKGPFISRKDYILFDRILTFEVSEY